MSMIKNLATECRWIGAHLGAALGQAEALCNAGTNWDSKELTHLAAEINELNGMLDGIYHAAKSLLSAEDFKQFIALSGIDEEIIQDGAAKVATLIKRKPGYGRN